MKRMSVDPASCIPSGLSLQTWENRCQSVEMADQYLASGGQGVIYPVEHIDGHRTSDLLVKIFHQGCPPNLPEMVTVLRENNRAYGIATCPALRALPLFLFTGTLAGKPVQGYIMRRVSGKTLVQIRDDVDDLNTYINLPWATRIALSQQFVEGMHILYSLRIVHADLNGQNLMVDMAQGSLTIIDLDGGAVAGTGQTPVVLGKPEPGWLAPEIMAELVRTTARQQVTVGIPVDLWSTACGVHYLLFGLAPFFFMAEQYQTAAYLQHHTWPALHGLNGIQTQNNHVFGYYERAYQQSPAQAQRLLTFAFQRGYLDTGQRPTAYQWLQELHAVAAQLPPAPRPPPPVPAPTPPPPVPARLTCTVCGEANTPDVVYCQHCLTRLGGERWCPHSPLPFAVPLRLLARFGKHRTPDRGRHCVVCGAAL